MVTLYLTSAATVLICLLILHFAHPDEFRRNECVAFSVIAFVPLVNTAVAFILGVITLTLLLILALIAVLNRIDNIKRRKA